MITGLIDESQLQDDYNKSTEEIDLEEIKNNSVTEKQISENELKQMVKDKEQKKSEVDIMSDDEIKKLLGED
jgi:hypothetical protein